MPAPSRNNFQRHQERLASEASRPDYRGLNVDYGRIIDVDEDTHQVMVQLLDGTLVGSDSETGSFIPLLNDISDILARFGPLRNNLSVRVMWRGDEPGSYAVAEIIGDESSNFLKQREIDEGGVGAYRIMSGGMV